MARPPRAERAAVHVVPVRLTEDELAILDSLRMGEESRSEVIRRLLARVSFAIDVARSRLDEIDPPSPKDPRKPAAAGDTAMFFPVGVAAVDVASGVVLHEGPPVPPIRPPEPAPLAEEPWPGDVRE